MKVSILIPLFFILSGCMSTPTYSPKSILKDNSAYLKADSEHAHGIFQALDQRLYITSINGIAAGDFFKWYPEDALINSGLTEVEVDYFYGQISSEGCVKFLAKKDERYIIRKQLDGWKVKYWVEIEDGEKVLNLPCDA